MKEGDKFYGKSSDEFQEINTAANILGLMAFVTVIDGPLDDRSIDFELIKMDARPN